MNNEEYENKLDQFAIEMLDAYCASRSPYPGKSELGEPLAPDSKTTEEISDELSSIMPVPLQDIVVYLRDHGYRLTTAADGTLRWQICGMKVHGETAIPTGRYLIDMKTVSPRFGGRQQYKFCGGRLPRIMGVPATQAC